MATEAVGEKIESRNNALLLEAFDTPFNKRDCAAAERLWSPPDALESDHFRSIDNFASELCSLTSHIWRGDLMSATSVQFTVAAHIMAALGFFSGKEISSATLAESVNADPTFVRKSLSKLSKAGLIRTTRGKNGASSLRRSPQQITLLDVYRASAAPPTFAIHSYPVEKRCPISRNIKGCMSSVLKKAQNSFENSLDRITLADVVGEIRQARR
jgi:Rrf2 family protein